MTDNVNHPPHYNQSNIKCSCGRQIECIDVTRHKNFNIGNSFKYLWRHEHKNGIEDLKKAIWYIQNEIDRLSTENVSNPVEYKPRPPFQPKK